jgi:hypothetical protein
MVRSVFVDTSGWYALIDRRDPDHARTVALVGSLVRGGVRLVSTDYVIDESCTLAKARSGSTTAYKLLALLEKTKALDIEWIGSERFGRAKDLFRKYHDQAFSFTDCTSFAVMRELDLNEAITKDGHFRIVGFSVLPES